MEKHQVLGAFQVRLNRRRLLLATGASTGLFIIGPVANRIAVAEAEADSDETREAGGRDHAGRRSWLAGDHHVHSKNSATYPMVLNAQMARQYGLAWMVNTDHGGPNHSKLYLEQAYPELLRSRQQVADVLQFWGMEFDTPAADHSTLMIPRTQAEAQMLYEIERRYSKRDDPTDPTRDTEAKMLEALRFMQSFQARPLLFANHPSRSAPGLGIYGQDTPREFRNWNDTAPDIAIGFEGAPGHQAGPLNPDGTPGRPRARGSYNLFPTLGGYDQMTARVGGLWDSLLGDGRRWWATATSDSHTNYRDGGSDFWPGEYSKTYVYAARDYADILDGLRKGRIFVTTGDLITGLDISVQALGRRQAPESTGRRGDREDDEADEEGGRQRRTGSLGDAVEVRAGGRVTVDIRVRPLRGTNARGEQPRVRRVDLIMGQVTGRTENLDSDTNPSTRVVARFSEADWQEQGDSLRMRYTLENVRDDSYIRVRGTNTPDLEPQPDVRGEDPWQDLWFYANPTFLTVR